MNWGRIAAALGLSVGIHLAGLGLLRGRLPALRLTSDPAPTSEVPLTILGSGENSRPGRAQASPSDRRSTGAGHARRGRMLPVATEKTGLGDRPIEAQEDSPIAAASAEGSVRPMADFGEAVPGLGDETAAGASGEGIGTAPGGAGSGSGAAPAIDLTPFVERLRRSAEQCGSVPPRGRSDHRGPPPVGLVRFCVAPDGVPTDVSLVASTGDQRLDRAALECIVPGAAPLPRADYCLVVPLRFH